MSRESAMERAVLLTRKIADELDDYAVGEIVKFANQTREARDEQTGRLAEELAKAHEEIRSLRAVADAARNTAAKTKKRVTRCDDEDDSDLGQRVSVLRGSAKTLGGCNFCSDATSPKLRHATHVMEV